MTDAQGQQFIPNADGSEEMVPTQVQMWMVLLLGFAAASVNFWSLQSGFALGRAVAETSKLLPLAI
jgi:hypothetical protein